MSKYNVAVFSAGCATIAAIVIGALLLSTLIFMLLFNAVVVGIFGVFRDLSFGESFLIVLFISVIASFFRTNSK